MKNSGTYAHRKKKIREFSRDRDLEFLLFKRNTVLLWRDVEKTEFISLSNSCSCLDYTQEVYAKYAIPSS